MRFLLAFLVAGLLALPAEAAFKAPVKVHHKQFFTGVVHVHHASPKPKATAKPKPKPAKPMRKHRRRRRAKAGS